MLNTVSALLWQLDPRSRDPLNTSGSDTSGPGREDLIQSLLDEDRRETSALLLVIAELTSDDEERARIRRALGARESTTLPRWMHGLADAEVSQVWQLQDVLRDGDDIVLGVRLPDGHELAIVVYIDFNSGTLAKDAFVVPEPIGQFLELVRANADEDASLNTLDPADAKVRITDAIKHWSMTVPREESESWPLCCPIVEWATRRLPDGGTGYQRPEWSEKQRRELRGRFFASSFGADLDDADRHSLLDAFLWFGTDYGWGDPLLWSPTTVEILLADWIPRKLIDEAEYLAKAPELLRAFIRFCHQECGIRAELTDQTLHSVDVWEPEYQRVIRSPRPQGPAALLAGLGLFDDEDQPGAR